MSEPTKISMLKILLPRIEPIAKLIFRNLNAISTATASGNDVVAAIRKLPTNVEPRPVNSARASPVIDNKVPAPIMANAAMENDN